MPTIADFKAVSLAGKPIDLAEYQGKVVLVVNTASQCGFTPQYAGLEALYQQYHAKGLEILGFPCNQFGKQEPGNASQIGAFCQKNYGVSFPMFERIDVNGHATIPLYQWLKKEAKGIFGQPIRWNFTKFLIGRDGKVIRRYASWTKPEKMAADIEKLLG
ncbi:glutathione peroxidase [Leeia sp. TBRC 13508]|uniref:Glutathione peroxidase n=1 Tax=Leeia speluncae TaxID=2884804 RepID=A0ABS8D583_9NEIS|nr:glutathione peroxidase [Leeia speluncae]MCB6183337.1 glutathione peroxidase [Leeia speluncae]